MDESTLAQCGSEELSAEDQELLKLYHHTFDDEWVDLDLIMDLLNNICSTSTDGEAQHSYVLWPLRTNLRIKAQILKHLACRS